jgi:hypothetical protein
MMLRQFLIEVRVRLMALFGRDALHHRAEEEMRFHLAMMEQRMTEAGTPPDVAGAKARREFGNPAAIKEQAVDSWRYALLSRLIQDMRYGLRLAVRNPMLAVIIVATLSLGIGANTAVFSVVEAVLLRPLPYKDSSQLVSIWLRNVRATGTSKMFASFRDYQAFATAGSFEHVAVATWATGGRLLRGHGPAQEILAMPVSESFFPCLEWNPHAGVSFPQTI